MTTTTIEAVLSAISDPEIRNIEANIYDLFTAYDIESIADEQLRRLCEAVGSPYNSLNVTQTRAFLKGYIAAHNSDGTSIAVADAWRLMTNDSEAYSVEYYPASLELHTTIDFDTDTASALLTLMRKVVTAGVQIISIILDTDAIVYDTLPSTQSEVYDTLPSTQDDVYAKVLAS